MKSPEGGLRMPSSPMNSGITPEVLSQWPQKELFKLSFPEGQEAKLMILGEAHRNQRCIQAQVELIRLIKPEVVLFELLGHYEISPPHFEKKLNPGQRGYGEEEEICYAYKELLELQKEMGFRITGCDLSLRERQIALIRYAKQNPGTYSVIENDRSFHGDEPHVVDLFTVERHDGKDFDEDPAANHQSGVINLAREEHMLKTIQKAHKECQGNVLVILGDAHCAALIQDSRMRDIPFVGAPLK